MQRSILLQPSSWNYQLDFCESVGWLCGGGIPAIGITDKTECAAVGVLGNDVLSLAWKITVAGLERMDTEVVGL